MKKETWLIREWKFAVSILSRLSYEEEELGSCLMESESESWGQWRVNKVIEAY